MAMLNTHLTSTVSLNLANESLSFSTNVSTNETSVELHVERVILVGLVAFCMMLATGGGNLLVLVAVVKDRTLHALANKLIASLAVTDMLVGFLVLPLASVNSILGDWPLGPIVCHLFITTDVTLCTNSILHLVVIACDRYWTATDATYRKGNIKYDRVFRIGVPLTWFWALAVVLPPYVGSHVGWSGVRQESTHCMISQNKGYTIYSTMGAFYLPLIAIIVIYTCVFYAVKATARKKQFKQHNRVEVTNELKMALLEKNQSASSTPVKECQTSKGDKSPISNGYSQEGKQNNDRQEIQVRLINGKPVSKTKRAIPNDSAKVTSRNHNPSTPKHKKLAQKRERRALRTLLIITGIFVTCWLPFFVLAIVTPFCGERCYNSTTDHITLVVTWLGYSNSLLNPVIYTIFRADFRSAFRKILKSSCG